MLKKTPNYFFRLICPLYAILAKQICNRKIVFLSLFLCSLLFTTPFFLNDSALSKEKGGQNQEDSSTVLELKKEIAKIREELSDLRKDIKSLTSLIKSAIANQPSLPEKGKASIKGSPFMGKEDAPVVLVEFSDYECPFCKQFFLETLPQIKRDFIDSGKVKYVYKDFPLSFHKKAYVAAESAHCAGEQGKYWEWHDLLLKNQRKINDAQLTEYAAQLGMNVKNFNKCLEDKKYSERVKKNVDAGMQNGINGTPSFILGVMNGKEEAEGKILTGARPYEFFKEAIENIYKKNTKHGRAG